MACPDFFVPEDFVHVGVAGGGLLGRLLAWRLALAGHRVQVFEVAPDALPLLRSRAAEGAQPTAAGFTAAGMLSPLAELDNAEPQVAALGWRSLQLWRSWCDVLPDAPRLSVQGSLLLAHRADAGAAQRVLDRLHAATRTPQWQALSPPEPVQALEPAQLHALEPAVQGPALAWMLPGEGLIDTVAAMAALYAAALATGRVQWHGASPVQAVLGQGAGLAPRLRLADGRELPFDVVVDVRGVGAAGDWPVRGVRGEVVHLDCPGHGLQRPLRLLHPRHRVYVVPRSERAVLVGASEIESEDRSPMSLRSAVELMAAAHSVVPALAEARITALDVNLRPALPDNNPMIDWNAGRLAINGLFRHGWLLAPALVDQALQDASLE